ncbi:class I SAM-dependent methyltransferase [Jeotgalibacillus sp. S-D1]|uniref:class I SAM-dependent methyltransferase n=1 Tax=Jeotgalibacillus sp. S-D1 TaxID=2552189 RepID=UPI0010593291|nr:class I SAM-dependent methyltransferase [Jeotgalibacillus sp. S-D1]TDL30873.1 class I SAM-dependent methyltransferase [Jeotgalibacillus sp. S-D1]
MFSNYGKLSTEVYQHTKPVGHSIDGDIEYYKERLKGCRGRILEAGAGTGRMLIPLLEEGFLIDGIDYSKDMLDFCRQQCEKRGLNPDLYEGVLQYFSLPSKYDAIILPAGTFGLLEQREEAVSALDCFYEHLNPGGRILIDLFLPCHFKAGTLSTTAFPLPDGDGITLENKSAQLDWLNQYTLSYLKYEKWSAGKLVETELQKFLIRWYGVEEFKLMLEKAGFHSITCSADYTYMEEPARQDQAYTFEAVRRE